MRGGGDGDARRAASGGRWRTPGRETALPDLDTEEAASLMLSRGFRHLPVVLDGELLGMVSLRDVLRPRIARR